MGYGWPCDRLPYVCCASLFRFAPKVLEMLLEPDESGWVDRRSVFRIVKYMLPAAPDRALEGVVDDFSRTIGAQMHEKSRFGGDDRVPIDRFLRREDLLDRFTLHHM